MTLEKVQHSMALELTQSFELQLPLLEENGLLGKRALGSTELSPWISP